MITNDSLVHIIEAPASWNTKYITPDGFECQLTLRGNTGQEVLDKAHGALAFLDQAGCKPISNGRAYTHAPVDNIAPPKSNGNGSNGDGRGWCPIHQCQMKRWEKDGRVWFSHKAGDQWCTGKEKSK